MRKILFWALTPSDQRLITDWCNDWEMRQDTWSGVESVWRDTDGVMFATVFETNDEGQRFTINGQAARINVPVPAYFEEKFPVILTQSAGITSNEQETS